MWVRKYKGKCLIKPSKKSFKANAQKLRRLIKENKSMSSAKLIQILNPIIRGWCNYHRKIISSRAFAKLDSIVFRSIWNWAKRRHTTRSKGWIKQKYFTTTGNRNWIFFGKVKDKIVTLFSAQSIKMVRHLKIRNSVNPFDYCWKDYFVARRRNGTDMQCRVI